MCEKCISEQQSGPDKVIHGMVPREEVIAFIENYRPHFADLPTALLMAGFLQILSERVKQDLNYTKENEHEYMGAMFQIALGDMTGCRIAFEPLENIGNGQAVPRDQALRVAMEEKQKGAKLQ